jgi:hypothetical protein
MDVAKSSSGTRSPGDFVDDCPEARHKANVEGAVAGKLVVALRLRRIGQLVARGVRSVEPNRIFFHSPTSPVCKRHRPGRLPATGDFKPLTIDFFASGW